MAIVGVTSELLVVLGFWAIYFRDKDEQRGSSPTIDDYLKAPAHPFRQAGGCRSAIKRQSSPERPLVSITTIVLNRKETLPQTIMSVLNQSYPNIEYIVVDGASTDGILEASI